MLALCIYSNGRGRQPTLSSVSRTLAAACATARPKRLSTTRMQDADSACCMTTYVHQAIFQRVIALGGVRESAKIWARFGSNGQFFAFAILDSSDCRWQNWVGDVGVLWAWACAPLSNSLTKRIECPFVPGMSGMLLGRPSP